MQQYQDIKLNPSQNSSLHCTFRPIRPSPGTLQFGGTAVHSALLRTIRFGLFGHHQVRCNSGELLSLPRYCVVHVSAYSAIIRCVRIRGNCCAFRATVNYILRPIRPSSDALQFGGTAVPSTLLRTIYFGLFGHHQVPCNSGELLSLPHYCELYTSAYSAIIRCVAIRGNCCAFPATVNCILRSIRPSSGALQFGGTAEPSALLRTTRFGLFGHHQMRWNSGELLCLPRCCELHVTAYSAIIRCVEFGGTAEPSALLRSLKRGRHSSSPELQRT
jgi:hypothetical protein